LDAQGNESLAVATAARTAADDMQRVKAELAQLEADVNNSRGAWRIDVASSRVVPGPNPRVPLTVAVSEGGQLQARLTAILAEAVRVDDELAAAVNMATGAAPLPNSPHDVRPEILDALSRPLPTDPKQFHDLWEQLTREEKDWLYQQNHFIGNQGGMPFADRDVYNRMNLAELMQANQAELERLRAAHPDWAAGKNQPMLDPQFPPAPDWPTWKEQWDAANRAQSGYQQVQQELQTHDAYPRLLAMLDNKGHAAVAMNNPDTAKRDVTFVPGTGQDLSRLQFSTVHSHQMLDAALGMDPSLRPGDVSVTTWMGYDRPMNLLEAANVSYADTGAQALDDFQAGMRASHHDLATGGPSINTVIGHSYGSTLVGDAGLCGHHLDANNVVAVGSPGVLAGHAGDLSLAPGAHFFATRAENDIITYATDTNLGVDPMGRNFGGIPFEAAPGPTWPLGMESVEAHSSYWEPRNPALLNMGRIIDGRLDVTPPAFRP
jgi:hypothetical protein